MNDCPESPSELAGELPSLIELLRLRAERQPEQLAYTFLLDGEAEEQHVTYGELDRQARAIGAWLQSHGSDGERVLLLYPPGLQYIAAFFGCLFAGAIAVPAYPPRLNHSLGRLQAIVTDAEAKFVLTTATILSRMAAFAEHAPRLNSTRWLATDELAMSSGLVESWTHPKVNHETLAFLQYTSGSTATPKGVMVSHGNILYNSASISLASQHPPDTTPLSWLPHFHDMGLIDGIIQPLFSGFSAFLMSPASFLQRPLRWLEAISRYGVTHTGGPNFAYDLCVRRTRPEQRQQLDLRRWQLAYNGAEPIRLETLERFAEAFAGCGFRREAFMPTYGLAEATLKVTAEWRAKPPVTCTVRAEALAQNQVIEALADEPGARRLPGSGHAGPETQLRIVDPQTLVECLPEEVGEIWISGPSVAKGYWKKPEETEQTFHARLGGTLGPTFLRSGDLGFLKNGDLFVTGRLKDLIISNGHNHYPQDIEQTVEQCHPALRVGGSAAFSLELKGREGLCIVAEVEPRALQPDPEAKLIFEAMRRAVAEQHELEIHHMLLLRAGKIPKTSSGKIQRHACREGFLNDTLRVLARWQSSSKGSTTADAQPAEFAERVAGQATGELSRPRRTADVIQDWLIDRVASSLQIEPGEMDVSQPFASFGLGSVQSVGLSGELADWLERPLPATLLYEYPTIAALSRFLADGPRTTDRKKERQAAPPTDGAGTPEPIAIVGIGCRFPGAENPEAFWQLLRAGVDAITEYASERWRTASVSEPSEPAQVAGPIPLPGGFLRQVDQFDAHFFSISPREAPFIDPQQRLLLEVAWEALEAAGQSPARLAGSQTGVFIGIGSSDYYLLRQSGRQANHAPYFTTGNSHSIAANRLSYLLDLRGPSIAIDTACSSSLVAVHLACESLRRGESSLALAGGVNLILNPHLTDELARAGMLAADGRCKVFDAEADGYARAEGCGIVILKRLSDAIRDGDQIVAQIKASAINQDGRSNGLTAPNGLAQQSVIRRALENARIAPSEIDFVETHGSGTSLGDPIEVNSLISVLSEGRSPEQACLLGSVKANIGHLEAAAGVAGLIKAALSLSHAEIPAQLHLRKINPRLSIEHTPFSIPTEPRGWPLSSHRRLAGVSSFGFGGTNAHVVLEEAPPSSEAQAETRRPLHLLTLSARSETALRALADRYATFLKEQAGAALSNVCFTANTGRAHFFRRLALLCASHEQALEKLEAFVGGRELPGLYSGSPPNRQRPRVAFVFSGEKASDATWARELYETLPAFRVALDEHYELLREISGPSPDSVPADALRFLDSGVERSAALFIIQSALAQVWMSWGIAPDILICTGVGEYVAGCVAEVFKPAEGLKLILEHAEDPAQFKSPRIPIISALNGRPLSAEEISNLGRGYGRRRQEQARAQTERGSEALFEDGCDLFLEFGPESRVRLETLEEKSGAKCKSWLSAQGDWSALLSTVAQLYLKGVDVDWDNFERPYRPRRVTLPTYPFERKRYWLDAPQDSITGEDMSQPRRPDEMNENLSAEASPQNGRHQQPTASPSTGPAPSEEPPDEARRNDILRTLSGIVAELLQMRVEGVDPQAPFLEMGADSIVLVNAVRTIENRFGVKISIRQLFEDLTTIDALATHIAQHAQPPTGQPQASQSAQHVTAPISAAPPVMRPTAKERAEDSEADAHSAPNPAKSASVSSSETTAERVMRMQLEAFSRLTAQQLESLGQGASEAPTPSPRHDAVRGLSRAPATELNEAVDASHTTRGLERSVSTETAPPASKTGRAVESQVAAPAPYVPYKRITPGTNGGLSSRQAKHLADLIARYTSRTQKSKQLAEHARPVLADSRASVGFRLSVKEMLYPITATRSLGSKIWDIDGSEYVDVTMGFGVHLFGHRAAFIQQALEEQLQEGVQLGPRVESAGEVAGLLRELTGHERVAFCNSGTEAVMTALRLARAFTGRSKIALFAGSYHGHSDGTLALAEINDGELTSIPMAPGVPKGVAADVSVLEYASPQSLDYLRAHAHELAAVLVEPVQSRNPSLQPRAFLHELRELTSAAGTTLIFDEMVTGFRVHPGGAQSWFGVQADLGTYGKIVGGGMPIGVVAGRSAYMDGIDGGAWAYGDASYPRAETTFFGGTFCMHPLTMAAALATLKHLKQEGPELQQRLNQRTSQLAADLNAYFTENEIPLRMANFGSLFRFVHSGNMDLFYYHLLEKGVYIWEWRSCFLSTAHTERDFDYFSRAVKESLEEMREGGFLPERSASGSGNTHHPNGKRTTTEERASATQSVESGGPAFPDGSDQPETGLSQTSRAASGRAALSGAQQQLWLLAQMGVEASLAYHESVIVELKGELAADILRDAFRLVVNRHEALRTAIEGEGECQRILTAVEMEVPLVDFTGTESSERQAAVDAWLKNEAQRPFDLTRPPLLRVFVLKIAEGRHLLFLTAHHIVIDSWSLSLLLNEVAKVYTARFEHTACELSPPMQFTEYLRELSRPAYQERLQQAELYWRGQFSEPTSPLSLATYRPPVKQYSGSTVSLRINADLTDRLKAYSRRSGCTLFMTLFAGYTALLHRLTGAERVVVGIPVSGRFIEGSESLIGYCTHLLPVISSLQDSASFDEHLRSSRSRLLVAYEHQEYPFAKLIHLLNPERDLSRTPIIQTTFNLEPLSGFPGFARLDVALVSSPVYYTKFDIGVNVIDIDGELRVDFDYDTELFDAAFVGHMAEQFEMLLEGAAELPEQAVGEVALMTEAERARLLVEWNDTKAPLPDAACVHELVEEQARLTPEATAVVCHERHLTYRELNRRANQLAHYLRGLGLGPESRVAVCVERSPEMMIGLLGILKAGCAYVPLDAEYPPERLSYMLEDAQASMLLTGRPLAGLFRRETIRVVELETLWPAIAGEVDENPGRLATADNLAYVIYTSGSTGRPKGVEISHSSVVNLLSSMRRLPGLGPEDTLLAVTTISFDIAALELFLPLTVGARLMIASREEARDGERLSQILSDSQITMMQATPATWRLLIEAGWRGIERLKILCGGEALPQKLAAALQERGASLWNMYGPTETTIWSTTDRVEGRSGGSIAIGKPIANTQIYLLDAHLRPVTVGMVGELYIGGDGLARGYHNRPEITAAKFIPHPFSGEPGMRLYRTGDLARYRQDGKIELLGRVDHQVKVRGYRIELGEIEAALCGHALVREAAVMVRERQAGDQRLVAYVVSNQEHPLASSELSAFLGRRLPEYMAPSGFVFLDSLPRYPNGKVNRGALPEQNDTRPQPQTPEALPQTRLELSIAGIWKEILRVGSVGLHENFFDLGGHSLLLAQVHRKLTEVTGKQFSLIEMFRYPTVAALAGYLNNGHQPDASDEAPRRISLRRSVATAATTEVAVVGVAGRFPGARTVEEFWENLRGGVESITFFTREELEAQGVAGATLDDPRLVKAGAFIEGMELFDAKFFGFSPREAEVTDPQHRVFLECAWEALDNAGYDSERFKGAIGVYASVGLNTYLLFNLADHESLLATHSDYQTFIGNDKDFVPSRVSYKLNLKGPSVNVQTACSSSLVAVHLACQSLLNGECDMTLAGGVALKVPAKTGYLHDEQGIDSPDGHCRAFDARAGGTIFGSGVGVVVLKRLADALSDGDHIHAVIKGSAVNNDGSLKISYTAPSPDGQAEVIQTALGVAQVEPRSIDYIEAHGTGTQLGDPIEIAALTKAFGHSAGVKNLCAIGSVKTNIGHLDTASGIAGLIKTILSLTHRELPPSLHFKEPNPQINFADSPFYVNDRIRKWDKNGGPRRAGVSSFGIGGTNAHVILEEAPAPAPPGESRPWQLLTLSAKTGSALDSATDDLAAHLRRHTELSFPDVAYTLQVGRRSFDQRRVIICRDAQDALAAIEGPDSKRVITQAAGSQPGPVAFLFPGQGTQYVQMGRELYQAEPHFRQTVDTCSELLAPHLGLDLRRALYPRDGEGEAAAERLNQTSLAQPALFVIQYALARLWMEWGIQPQAMLGHSVGEYTAACLAGLFSLADGLALIAARGRLMQSLPEGAMLAVPLPEDEARSLLNEHLSLAAVNGASQCVISGETTAIHQLERELAEREVMCSRLQTSHAFHSGMMEPVVERFAREVARVALKPPSLPWLSNLTGDWISPEEATNPHYWARQLRETVRFADGLGKLLETPEQILLEVGPGQSLSAQVRRHPLKQPAQVVVSSMRHQRDRDPDTAVLLTALGRLWLGGCEINWPAFHAHQPRRRVPLPAYPFERQRYWIDPPSRGRAVSSVRPPLHKRADLSQWFYLPGWQPTAPLLGRGAEGNPAHVSRLIFVNDNPFGLKFLTRLEGQAGGALITVRAGERYTKLNESCYVVNPLRADDYRRLLEDLRPDGKLPNQILHCWNVSDADEAQAESLSIDDYQHAGFESLIHLGKALGETDEAVELLVISTNLQSITGAEDLRPEKATLLGPCKTIPQEYPHLACRSLDLVLPEPESWQETHLLEQLLAEIETTTAERVIAYRNGSRLAQAFQAAPFGEPTEGSPLHLREDGVYLITGGLGKIGLSLAEYLAGATRGKLGLIVRSPFPARGDWNQWLKTHDEDETSRKIRGLLALEETGAKVLVLRADVTNQEEMQQVINQVEEELGQINGVVHAAGIVPEKTFRLIGESDELRAGWSQNPKLQGLVVLERVLRGRKIDFCLLMSSLASVLGGLGYTTYSAANLFMDAFAQKQNRLGPAPWISVNWDAWIFEGERPDERGVGVSLAEMSMTPEEGVQIFRRLLSTAPVTQVVISTAALQERIDRWTKPESLRAAQQHSGPQSLHPRPELPTTYMPPGTETERAIAAIWRELLGVEQVGIHDDFFALGGESLLAVQLTSRLRAALQVEIGARDLFEASTVAALAAIVEGKRTHEQAPDTRPLLPSPRSGASSLSFAQERLWVACQLGRGEAAYNIPTATLLRGALDKTALEQSLTEIVRRHETLRTSFPVVDGRPLPVIAPPRDLQLPLVDLRDLPAEERFSGARSLAGEDAQKPFDLTDSPLFRARLVRTGDEEHVLLLTMHHLVTDGWSLGILIGEVAALYGAFSKGEPSPLSDLPIQYSDFAEWQRAALSGKKLESLLDYWKGQLGDNLPKLELPTDRPRSTIKTFRGTTVPVHLPLPLAESLKALGQEERATLFMTLLAAFKVLLRHYSGENRLAVGTDVAGRHHEGVEGLIGFFVNQLVLLTDLSGDPSFKSLLARVREVALGAFTYQELPSELLIDALKPERAATHSPLFEVEFVLQNAPQPPMQLPHLSISPIEVENPYAKVDLLLTLRETEDGLRGAFEYKAELFDLSTVEGMLRDYEAILRTVVAEPETSLSSLDEMLAAARRERNLLKGREVKGAAQTRLKNARRKPLSADAKSEGAR